MAAATLLFCERCSSASNPDNLIYEWDARAVILRYGERREHCPVADFEFLIDVMEVLFDSAVGNIQPAPNFLVRQPFRHQTHDLSLAIFEHRQRIIRDGDVPLLPRYGLSRGQRQQPPAIRDLPQGLHQNFDLHVLRNDTVGSFNGCGEEDQPRRLSELAMVRISSPVRPGSDMSRNGDVRHQIPNRFDAARTVTAACDKPSE